MVQRLLQAANQLCSGEDPKAPFSVLHHAAKQGDHGIVALLLDIDERLVHSQDKEGWFALHHAARQGNVPVIKTLLAHHASCLARTTSGFVPVYLAIRGGHVDAVDCLLNAVPHGRRHNHVLHVYRMPSVSLTAVTNPGILRALHKHVYKDHPEFTLWIRDVAAGGNAGAVDVLVEGGVDLEAPGLFPDGWSALHIATHNCRGEVCTAMLKHGANRDAKDAKGRTPLHRVALCTAVRGWERAAATAELLLKWGADVTEKDCDGHTAADLVKADTAPDRTKAPLAAVLAKARADQCSRPSLTATHYDAQLGRARRGGPPETPVMLPDIFPDDARCVSRTSIGYR
eukprot:g4373.t1